MELSSSQHKKLREALMSAYPTRQDLERMVFDGLGKRLGNITGAGNLQQTVFELVEWTVAQGRVEDLVQAALEQNSQNAQLRGLVDCLGIRIRAVPVEDLEELYSKEDNSPVLDLAVSPDGETLVSGHEDGMIKVWSLATGILGRRPLEGHEGTIYCLAMSPDGNRLVSGGEGSMIGMWSLCEEDIWPIHSSHKGTIYCLAISPDGKTMVSGADDGVIIVWKLSTRQEIYSFLGHDGALTSAEFSADGKILVTGSEDGTVKKWKLSSTSCLLMHVFKGHEEPVRCVGVSPDGNTLVSGGESRWQYAGEWG